MCAFSGGTVFGECPPEFARLRVVVISGSTKITMTHSISFFQNPDTCAELYFFA